MKFVNCYHCHTERCDHAIGEDEEYVVEAIKEGIKVLGFSDHVMLKNHSQPGIRGDYELLDDYISSISRLKEKYKDQIEIHIGLECEYFPQYEDYYHWLLKEKGIEYLIQGQHAYISDENKIEFYFEKDKFEDALPHFLSDLIKGMSTGLFKYVAHPDMHLNFAVSQPDLFIESSKKICEASLKYNVPLEINLCRHKAKEEMLNQPIYPYEEFWKIVGEMGCKVFVGHDTHNPSTFHCKDYRYAEYLINKYKLNYIPEMKF